jgi:polyferredoxin
MEEIGKPKGLIRYDSENGIAKGTKLKVTPRIIGYSAVLLLLVVGLSFGISTRSNIETTILRAPGMLFQKVGTDSLSNLYNFKIVNKTHEKMLLKLKLESHRGTIKHIGSVNKLNLNDAGMSEGTFFVTIHRKDIQARKTKITFSIMNGEKLLEKYSTNFLGPAK